MNSSQWGEFVCAVFFVTIQSRGNLHKFANHACMNEHNFGNFFGDVASMSKKEASQMRFANEALNSYNIKMQYTSQAQVKIRVYQHTEMRSKMADLNELNEKVEQIKADIREQLEKIENTKGVYEYKKPFSTRTVLSAD